MTLEHIPHAGEFIATVRRSIADNHETIVFFQIPNARYVLCDVAFWDIYYEHCSYFTKGSLARLFRANGFEVKDLWTVYDDQYLMIEARPVDGQLGAMPLPDEESAAETLQMVDYFVEHYETKRAEWQHRLAEMKSAGRKVVLWGGGSKGVAFLTTLDQSLDDIAYAVDINPIKTGTFMASTGQEIIAPSFLEAYRPDDVIIMNPVYVDEITSDLQAMGLAPTIYTL